MQTKFTPGPWTLIGPGEIDLIQVNAPGKNSYDNIVVNVLPNEYLPGDWKANASLIAAAPDMYLALSYALAALKEMGILEATQQLIIDAQRKALGV